LLNPLNTIDDLVKSHPKEGQRKSSSNRGAQFPRNKAYLSGTPQRQRMKHDATNGLFTKPSLMGIVNKLPGSVNFLLGQNLSILKT
jgi:hypothetical protein